MSFVNSRLENIFFTISKGRVSQDDVMPELFRFGEIKDLLEKCDTDLKQRPGHVISYSSKPHRTIYLPNKICF